jgi:hypothetical protein
MVGYLTFIGILSNASVNPEYGPDQESTGTGFTGCIPYGICSPSVNILA